MIYILIPTFNEESNIKKIFSKFTKIKKKFDNTNFKLLFIDDGSTDKTWEEITNIKYQSKDIRALKLIRNVGKEVAVQTAFDYMSNKKFESIIVIDADLQHPFEIIEKFIIEKNFLVIQGIRSKTSVSYFRKILTFIFYSIINSISLNKIIINSTDFCMINKKAFRYVRRINSEKFILKQTLSTIKNKKLIYFNSPRRDGDKSKFNLRALVNLGLEFFTKNTNFPLKLIFFSAFFSIVVSVFVSIYVLFFASHLI